MPRKGKYEELKLWVDEYKAFGYMVVYPSYQLNVCVLAHNEAEAKIKIESTYPGAQIELLKTYLRTQI